MVNVVSAVSGTQSAPLRTDVQGNSAPAPSPPPPLSSIDFVVSGIYVDNLQNVAILEYRSSQTDQVIQQYPNQAQINAFKAAQRLAEQASTSHAEAAAQHAAADPGAHTTTVTTDHVSAGTGSSSDASRGSSDTGGKTSVVA
jgi:hypothetical protein